MKQDSLKISRFRSFRGSVKLPGSKSIANRFLLCAALAKGKTKLLNLPLAEDVEVLLKVLPQLGVSISQSKASTQGSYDVLGNQGLFPFRPEQQIKLHLENAGTAIRPLAAILCTSSRGTFHLSGNSRMHERPIEDLSIALQTLGANIRCSPVGCPPIHIQAKGLSGGTVHLPASTSSQFASALLLAAPLMEDGLELKLLQKPVSKPYIDLSLDVMKQFSVITEKRNAQNYYVPGGQSYVSPGKLLVEGDATAATYFFAAAALPGCGPVRVHGLPSDSLQGDLQFIHLLKEMGAQTRIQKDFIEVRGPEHKKMPRLRALDVDMKDMPDAAMTLAVLALFTDGSTHIRGIANLMFKESRRLEALATELRKLGAQVEQTDSSLHIKAPERLRPTSIDTYGDHRMAMAFSIAAYGTELHINNPGCVAKTYRNFFDDFLPLCSSNSSRKPIQHP